MAANSFIVAGAVGLATALAVWGLVEWLDQPGEADPEASGADPTPEEARLAWPLVAGRADEGGSNTFVFVGLGPQAALASLSLPDGAQWDGPGYGTLTLGAGESCQLEDGPCPAVDTATAGDGPRFGRHDHNATVVRFWAFDVNGRLFATNAPATERDPYTLHPSFTGLPSGTWYLGTGEPPEGTRDLPMFKAQARALLDGLPVGAVATTVTGQFAWYMGGDLVLSAQMLSIVPAR